MSALDPAAMVPAVTHAARQAGARIMEVYTGDFAVDTKQDGSPVTIADRDSHEIICAALDRVTPGMPVMSEESTQAGYAERRHWAQYWLIDPLDGTKEFVNRRGEFTVNIALMENDEPRLGVVYTPAQELLHWGIVGSGAYRSVGGGDSDCIRVRSDTSDKPTVVASRSHGRGNLQKFLDSVQRQYGDYKLATMGSALKICLVAEGGGDVYPRLGLTSEWDTAAAHAVLLAAGGVISDCDRQPLRYNKQSVLNPWFIVAGDQRTDWHQHLQGIDTG